MSDQPPVQADRAGALDLNKLPEMQQQPIPETEVDSDDAPTSGTTPTPEEGAAHADKAWNG